MLEEEKVVFNTFTEYFNKHLLPLALQYGMTPSDFWNGEPELLESYHIFYKIKLKAIDMEEWKMGLYVFTGVQTALANAFGKKGSPPRKYPSESFLSQADTKINKQKLLEANIKKMIEKSNKAFYQKKGNE